MPCARKILHRANANITGVIQFNELTTLSMTKYRHFFFNFVIPEIDSSKTLREQWKFHDTLIF